MKKILVICGPTATGKTSLGIQLAKQFKGEVISADSRQIYRGMDIGTGKDIEKGQWKKDHWEIRRIPLWMLDMINPDQRFSAAEYVELAQKKIKEIQRRHKLPIIVGGSGFYLKGLIDGLGTLGITPDWGLRWQLKDLSTQKLFKMLSRLDSERAAAMNLSDRKNSRRLVRAIEIAQEKFKPKMKPQKERKEMLIIGLTAPRKVLYQRIDKRVNRRVEQGIEGEIKKLLVKGYTWDASALGETLGYQEWQPFFKGESTRQEAIQRWQFNENAYARRQLTWFKRDKRIKWFDFTEKGWQGEVVKLIREWYSEVNAEED